MNVVFILGDGFGKVLGEVNVHQDMMMPFAGDYSLGRGRYFHALRAEANFNRAFHRGPVFRLIEKNILLHIFRGPGVNGKENHNSDGKN